MDAQHSTVLVIFPGFEALDLAGPHEVFAMAARHTGGPGPLVVAARAEPVVSSSGLPVTPAAAIGDLRGPVDTLVVTGGRGVLGACADPELVDWVAGTAAGARQVASVCSGAFLLAEAGLLDGRRVTTHWGRCAELAERYPLVLVDPDPIYVRDGPVWTSAGVTAGIDLALALVERDHGAELARTIARELVMFVQRPGSQAQFSTQLAAQVPPRAPLRELVGWIAGHLDAELTVPVLAARAGMSERHFARVFREETGRTPAAYVEDVRLEAARRLLESTDRPLAAVARCCGFGSVETMHRSFRRVVRVTPGEYRERFAGTGV